MNNCLTKEDIYRDIPHMSEGNYDLVITQAALGCGAAFSFIASRDAK